MMSSLERHHCRYSRHHAKLPQVAKLTAPAIQEVELHKPSGSSSEMHFFAKTGIHGSRRNTRATIAIPGKGKPDCCITGPAHVMRSIN